MALRGVLGESASVVLDSQLMLPNALLEDGFRFRFPTISTALLSDACL